MYDFRINVYSSINVFKLIKIGTLNIELQGYLCIFDKCLAAKKSLTAVSASIFGREYLLALKIVKMLYKLVISGRGIKEKWWISQNIVFQVG